MMSTVLFVSDELQGTNETLQDTDILDSICRWKPHWINRQDEISDMIVFLTEFGWIHCKLSPALVRDIFYEFA